MDLWDGVTWFGGSDHVGQEVVVPSGALGFAAHGVPSRLRAGDVRSRPARRCGAGFSGPSPVRLRCRPPFMVTSDTRCGGFPIARRLRTACRNRCGESLAPMMWWGARSSSRPRSRGWGTTLPTAANPGRPALGKPQHRPLQAPGIRRIERVGEGVAARNAVRQAHETARKPLLDTAEALHVGAAPAAAQGREKTDHRHPVRVAERRIAPTRIHNFFKYMSKLFLVGPPHTLASTHHESSYSQNTHRRFKCDCPVRVRKSDLLHSTRT